jgi:pimeloyl-ACP methyl ester carboxylesterase
MNREAWTMSAFGADVAAVIKALNLRGAALVGHSMGGPVIVEAAKQISNRLIGLVVVDSFHNLDESMTPEEIEEFLQPWVEDFAGAMQRWVRETMFVPASDSAMIDRIAKDMSAAPPEVGLGAGREILRGSSENTLEGIGVPVVAINSDAVPTNAESLRRYGLKLNLMSGVGHFVMMEDPDNFNRLLAEAIAGFE